ncbi:MAG: hypothetical protein WC379_13450 [Methanoregula sp.]|jgi:hypothetical protein
MRKEPSKTTYKELFALSGNVCAFPGCKQKMFEENHNLIGQICHIEAAEPSGERYNPGQTDKERADFENLILLCANHHLITNDVSKYSVEKLKAMKKSHEDRFRDHQYLIDPAELNRILSLLDEKVARISKLEDEIKLNSKPRYEMKVDIELILVSNGLRLLGITGMNTGDLPITLSYWGFGLPNGNYIPGFPYLLPVPVKFPYKLLPGESITVGMEFSRIIATLKTAGYPNTICLRGFFQDQLKKQYERTTEPFNSYLK